MVHVFCVASDPTKAAALVTSAHRHGLPLHVHVLPTWNGYVDKITHMIDLLASVPDDDMCVFVDAYDVVCYADADEIHTKYTALGGDIVFGAELNCYPEHNEALYRYVDQETGQDPTPTLYAYLNSGGYAGTKKALLAMLRWRDPATVEEMCSYGGDQNYFTHFYLEQCLNPHLGLKVVLDRGQTLFQNMARVEWNECFLVAQDARVRFRNDVLDTTPCFVHLNGYNFYDYVMRNEVTGREENALAVLVASGAGPLPYRVPYYIMYRGEEQRNLPQTPSM